jgi:hypothetical protein
MAEKTEANLMIVRQAFPAAQEAFAVYGDPVSSLTVDVGWHDVGVSPERGATAVVRRGGPLTDLVGEIVRVQRTGGRDALTVSPVLVWVLGETDVIADFSLARRAFFALAPLSLDRLAVSVEVMR